MLDRRREVHDALLLIRDFGWPTTDGVYRTVVRFNQSFEILRAQVSSEISEPDFPSIHELHKMIGDVGHGCVPWAFHDAGRPAFWDKVVELATDAMNEVLRFPEPSLRAETLPSDFPITYVGTMLPRNPSPDEHCVEEDEELGSIHFQRWWELRCRTVEVLRHYGYTGPEDSVAIERLSFFLTEDELDDEQNVYISVGPCFSLSVDVVAAISNVFRKYDGWVAVCPCSENCIISAGGKGIQLVGDALKDCKTLDEVIDVARIETETQ